MSVNSILYGFAFGSIILSILFYLGIGVEIDDSMRITMFNENANNFASMMCMTFAIVLCKFIMLDCFSLKMFRYIFIIPLLLFLSIIVSTASRGAFISLTVIVLIIIFTIKVKYKLTKPIIIIIGLIVFFYGLQYISNIETLYDRLIISLSENDTSGRTDRWSILLPYALKQPFFGIGEAGYTIISNNVFYSNDISGEGSPHNVILEVFLYTGLVGLIPMIIFWSRIGIYSFRIYIKTKDILPLLLFIPIFMQIMSGQMLNFKIIWVLFSYILYVYSNHNTTHKRILS